MTPQDLIVAFETVAEAPDGVKRLRELVLQLAVRGKLVAQDPEDEAASVLLERIAVEKARLVREKVIRKPKVLPPLTADNLPFATPQGWAWCRFEIVHRKLGAGSTPLGGKRAYVEDGIKFLRSQNVYNDGLRLDGVARIPLTIHARMHKTTVQPNDVLLNITGASIARAAVVPADFDEANVSQHVAIVRQVLPAMKGWVHLFLVSPLGFDNIMGVQVGISREGLSMGNLKKFALPVPPLAEQHRIVARVDELMGLLDRLDAARTARDTTRAAARDAALMALREADTSVEIEVAWSRFAERMDDLLCDPADIDPLRQAVLQLAVRGKLVAQDAGDEPASVLLERIAAEKARQVKEKKIKKPKGVPLVERGDLPYELPDSWHWSRLGSLLSEGPSNGWSPKGVDFDTGVRTLKLSATTRGVFDGSYFKFVDAQLDEDSPLWLRPGDLLIQRSNTPQYVGMAAVYEGEEHRFMYPDLMMRCRMMPGMDVAFTHRTLIAPFNRRWFKEKASGTSQSMVKVNQGTVRSTLIPVPPEQEQHRIVARVNALMALLDRLEARLATAQSTHASFASAAVHHLDA